MNGRYVSTGRGRAHNFGRAVPFPHVDQFEPREREVDPVSIPPMKISTRDKRMQLAAKQNGHDANLSKEKPKINKPGTFDLVSSLVDKQFRKQHDSELVAAQEQQLHQNLKRRLEKQTFEETVAGSVALNSGRQPPCSALPKEKNKKGQSIKLASNPLSASIVTNASNTVNNNSTSVKQVNIMDDFDFFGPLPSIAVPVLQPIALNGGQLIQFDPVEPDAPPDGLISLNGDQVNPYAAFKKLVPSDIDQLIQDNPTDGPNAVNADQPAQVKTIAVLEEIWSLYANPEVQVNPATESEKRVLQNADPEAQVGPVMESEKPVSQVADPEVQVNLANEPEKPVLQNADPEAQVNPAVELESLISVNVCPQVEVDATVESEQPVSMDLDPVVEMESSPVNATLSVPSNALEPAKDNKTRARKIPPSCMAARNMDDLEDDILEDLSHQEYFGFDFEESIDELDDLKKQTDKPKEAGPSMKPSNPGPSVADKFKPLKHTAPAQSAIKKKKDNSSSSLFRSSNPRDHNLCKEVEFDLSKVSLTKLVYNGDFQELLIKPDTHKQ